MTLAGIPLSGQIDAVYRRGERWEVVDWKTGSGSPDPLQLAVYRLAWARVVHVRLEQVDAAFYSVASGERMVPVVLPDEAELAAELATRIGSVSVPTTKPRASHTSPR